MSATHQPELPKVYAAIVAVMDDLSKEGISKSRKNQQQGYSFRGIDDIYNALAPILAKHHLCIIPKGRGRTSEERPTKSGGTMLHVNVEMAFELVCSLDGSREEVVVYGESMDSGDKATNKAQSAAYKYAAMMAFCIPTEGDNDTENHTPEIASKQTATAAKPKATTAARPAADAAAPVTENELKARANIFGAQIAGCSTRPTLTATVSRGNKLLLELKNAALPEYDRLMKEISDKQNSLLEGTAA